MQGTRAQPGVIPRAVEVGTLMSDCFQELTYIEALFDHKRQMHEYDVSLSVSYMEIYRDEVYDLLVDRDSVSHTFSVYQDSARYKTANFPHPSSSKRLLSYQ
jgi:Kinesin motor domain